MNFSVRGSWKKSPMSPIEEQMKTALGYHQAGELEKAKALYAAVLNVEPNQPDALHLSGVIEYQSGHPEAAIHMIRTAIAMDPEQQAFYSNLGNALMAGDRLEEAVLCYQQAIGLDPDAAEAHFNLGNALFSLKGYHEAVACYQKALALTPCFPQARCNLGNALMAQGDVEGAAECYQKAISLKPDYTDAYLNLGRVYKEQGKWTNALSCYEQAARLEPDCADAHYNMGNLFHVQGRYEEAIAPYEQAIRIRPDYRDAHDNLGKTFRDEGMLDEAMSCYQRSLHLNPDNPETRFDVATLHLLQGNFDEGWPMYECRFQRENWQAVYPHRLKMPRWKGEPFSGKRLLVHSEQGFGDSLQFVRYLPMVKQRGGEVIFETVGPLMDLFRHLEGVDRVIEGPAPTDEASGCDSYVPLLSLPGIFETRLETIPSQVPYVFADARRVRDWEKRLPKKRGLRVGLVWAGKSTDRRRSCGLKELIPLLQVPGVDFIGLQKGSPAKEVLALPRARAFPNIGEDVEDFADTAAVIEHLELIISIDTSVAHLAGAMGKPVWVLLLRSPDWRWLMDRTDSPWYPTMRLFRQSRSGCWEDAVNSMAQALHEAVRLGGAKEMEAQ